MMLSRFNSVFADWPVETRRRLAALAITGFLASFALGAIDVMMPLWATRELGMTAADWANVRSLRFAGVLVGVILLGAVSDRFGQRRTAIGMLTITGLVTALFGLNSRFVLWLLMPLFGALVSTVYVNFNTLTQLATTNRQGAANTVYRSVGAAAGLVAPAAAISLAAAWGGYPAVFLALGPLLAVAGWLLLGYPVREPFKPLAHPVVEVRLLMQSYAAAWREKPLMRFIHLSSLWFSVLGCVGAFSAIRLTRELGMSDHAFGWLSTAIGGVTLALLVAAGRFLDRVSLRRLHGGAGVAAAAGTLLMGCGDSPVATGAGLAVAASLMTLLVGPTSMWVSRQAGAATQGSAFAVQKVITALYFSTAMFLFGALERRVGIRVSLLIGGGAGLVSAFAFLLLPEPPRPAGAGAGENRVKTV
jgi:MFS family permease